MDSSGLDLACFLLRSVLGVVMLAHGLNHIFGGGKIAGTGRWFASLGMKPGPLHAWLASITEVVCGPMLILGLLTPLAAAGVVGVMAVAWLINHRGNGFFIFRPGEGWEYVMTLFFAAIALGGIGPGRWSIDHGIGIADDLDGWTGLAISALGGGGGALLLLAVFWRPPRKDPAAS